MYYQFNGINMFYCLSGNYNAQESILLIHGLGWSHEYFLNILNYPLLISNYRLIFVDLIGFGRSDKPENFDYNLSSQAEICCSLLNDLGVDKYHIIAHSMGGVVAQYVAEKIKTMSFVNCEGTLVPEDCILSGFIANQGKERFLEKGYDNLKKKWQGSLFFNYFNMASPWGIFLSSQSLVHFTLEQKILERFISLNLKKIYIYGEKNRGKKKTEAHFKKAGIQVEYIRNSGHSMVEENPDDFYQKLIEFLM